jgi:phenylalanyl-tRNA synthetase beta chain
VIDAYPLPAETIEIELPIAEVERILGMDFAVETAADLLSRLQFDVTIEGDTLHITAPDHRLDIGAEVIGQADLIEEIARINGYDQIPTTIMADEMPPQWANIALEREELTRDVLVALGLRENISYRFTTPEYEQRLIPPGAESNLPDAGYVEMANPISADKTVLRHTLLISLLENARDNARYIQRQQVFEIGNIYLQGDNLLPEEPRHLGILMTGLNEIGDWSRNNINQNMDFYDLKGTVEGLLDGMHIKGASYSRNSHSSFHPGRSALLNVQGVEIGPFGELHPAVAARFELADAPVLVAEFDLDALLEFTTDTHTVAPLPVTPPVYQDIALVVPETTPAAEIETVIAVAGGDLLREARLFDIYRGDSIPQGHKSLAYNLVFQTDEKTLKEKDATKARQKIAQALQKQLGAMIRE